MFKFDDTTDTVILFILLGVILLCISFFLIILYNNIIFGFGFNIIVEDVNADHNCYTNTTQVKIGNPNEPPPPNVTASINVTHFGFCNSA